MGSYKLSVEAERDLRKIARYTALTWGERQAIKYPEQITAGIRFVAAFPTWGRPYTTRQGTHYQRHRVAEHMIFFQPREDGIFIVRVLHVMMDFDRHLD